MELKVVEVSKQLRTILTACNPNLTDLTTQTVIGLDPGETTGVAILRDGEILVGQLATKNIGTAYTALRKLVIEYPPDHLRYEDYRIYGWKANDHTWSNLHTAQLIGAIQVLAHIEDIETSCLMAQNAKAFWTDDKLKACGLWIKGQRHGRDALRHLLYRLGFPGTGTPING